MRPFLFWIGYVLGTVMLFIGLLVLTGALTFRGMEGAEGGTLRVVFGIVLMLYGIYRISFTEMQRRRARRA